MAHEYKVGEEAYALLMHEAEQHPPGSAEEKNKTEQGDSPPAAIEEALVPDIDFDYLKATNPDTVGWMYIPDSNVNYPVVQGDDNRHYVSTMFDGTVNKSGSIFMDYRNNHDMNDRHTIIYGHNMRNKTMFSDITKYIEQSYYDEHPTGYYLTPEKNYQFDIVVAYVASLADHAWQLEFASEADINSWLEDAIDRSRFESSAVFKPGDSLITLSTCSYDFDDARFVLIGILKEC